jgi:hypothetical protein
VGQPYGGRGEDGDTIATLRDILRSGELDGWVSSSQFDAINEQICREQDCKHCGHHGLYCSEYQKTGQHWGVRSFQVCPECGWAVDF